MTHLLDTQLLLWGLFRRDRLSARALRWIMDPEVVPIFSTVSVIEVAIKFARGRPDFAVNPEDFVALLTDTGYRPLDVTPAHAARLARLPALHGDPFDRLLLAQAEVEGLTLLTADHALGGYPGPVLLV